MSKQNTSGLNEDNLPNSTEDDVLNFLKSIEEAWATEEAKLKNASSDDRSLLKDLLKPFAGMMPDVAKRINMTIPEISDDIEEVSILTHSSLNATIGRNPKTRRWVIQIDPFLLRFYYEMAKILYSQVGLRLPSGDTIPSPVSFDEAVQATSRLFRSYMNSDVSVKGLSSSSLSPSSLLLSAVTLNICTWFTIAHELGHYVVLKLKNPPEEFLQVMESVAFHSRVTLGVDDMEKIRRWTAEIAADLIGFQLVLGYIANKDAVHQVYTYHACELMFTFFGMLVYAKFGDNYFAQSRGTHHPPIEMRRQVLREVAAKNGFNKPVSEAQRLYEIAFRLAKTARAADAA
jgi:hypothetical protein